VEADRTAAQDHVVCGPDCQCGCEAGLTIPVRSAATTPVELQKRIDALLDEGLTTDEILARLEADELSAAKISLRRRFRRLNQVYAFLASYFWLPCPICGEMFGGHECGTKSVGTRIACWRHG
jgi:hypothetical protein